MRLIIAGSRDITDYAIVKNFLDKLVAEKKIILSEIDYVLNGDCPTGVDALAKRWSERNDLKLWSCPADWDTYGKAAGPIRNEYMANMAQMLVLIWDGKSKGSRNMLWEARNYGLTIYQYNTTLKVEVEGNDV